MRFPCTSDVSVNISKDVLFAGCVQCAVAAAHVLIGANGAEEFVCGASGDLLRTAVHLDAVYQKPASVTQVYASSG